VLKSHCLDYPDSSLFVGIGLVNEFIGAGIKE